MKSADELAQELLATAFEIESEAHKKAEALRHAAFLLTGAAPANGKFNNDSRFSGFPRAPESRPKVNTPVSVGGNSMTITEHIHAAALLAVARHESRGYIDHPDIMREVPEGPERARIKQNVYVAMKKLVKDGRWVLVQNGFWPAGKPINPAVAPRHACPPEQNRPFPKA